MRPLRLPQSVERATSVCPIGESLVEGSEPLGRIFVLGAKVSGGGRSGPPL